MAKHTPGPWKIGRGSTGRGRAPTIEVRAPHESGVDQCVATVTGIAVGTANARLIAAAPEMYEALRKAERLAWEVGCETVDGVNTILEDGRGDLWREISAILAKIEGAK